MWIRDVVHVIRDENGLTTDLVGRFMFDISERKQADDALKQYVDRLMTLHQIDQAILAAQSIGEIAEAAVPPPIFDTALRDALAHELARRIEQRLAAELPRLIESTLRDFLAEQEMIDALQPPN